jgi:hypothetical protein
MYTQQQRFIPRRQLSTAEIQHYFSSQPVSLRWAIIAFLIGAGLIIAGISNMTVLVVGLVIALTSASYILLITTSKPSDEQYDEWLDSQTDAIYFWALQTLGIDERDITDSVYCLHSFVLPGSQAARAHSDQAVRARKGKDGKLRCSINVYTYFFFTRNSLALFVGTINGWDASTEQRTHWYRYQHIMDITPDRFHDTVNIEDRQLRCSIEQCRLELINGNTIFLTTALQATHHNKQRNTTIYLLPETGFESTLRDVRRLIFFKQ